MKNAVFLTFVFSALLLSCSKRDPDGTSVNLNLSGFLQTSGTPQYGGVYIVGRSIDDTSEIALGLQYGQTDFFVDLKTGQWEFYAIGWTGDDSLRANGANPHLTGDNRCFYTGVIDLSDPEETVEIILSKDGCLEEIRPGKKVVEDRLFQSTLNTQFVDLNIFSCLSLNPGTLPTGCLGTSGTTGNEGITGSYQVILPGDIYKDGFHEPLPGLDSKCFNITNSNQLRVPGGRIGEDSIISPIIVAYPLPECGGDPIKFFFKDGFIQDLNDGNIKTHSEINDNVSLSVFFEHNPTTENFEFDPFGNGSDGDVTITSLEETTLFAADHYISVQSQVDDFTLATDGLASAIVPGKEVLMHIYDGSACGDPKYKTGLYRFFIVKEIHSSTIEFFEPIKDMFGASSNLTIGANCIVQIVRSYNFENLHIDHNQIKSNFIFDGQKGGIVSVKVRNNLYINGSTPYAFNVDYAGSDTSVPTADCTGLIECAQFGGGTGTIGGGILILRPKNMFMDSSTDISIQADGQSGAFAGTIHLSTRGAYFNTAAKIYIDALNFTEGSVRVDYCSMDNIGGGGFSTNMISTGYSLNQRNILCN